MTDTQENIPERSFRIVSQAIQDFSFENPGFGKSISPNANGPEISVNVNLKTEKFSQNKDFYHVSVNIRSESKIVDEKLFILELTYDGLFEVKGFDDELRNQIVNIQAPSLLFPFMRRIIADSTADGGYPPLYLDPIDFAGLHFKKQAEKNNKKT